MITLKKADAWKLITASDEELLSKGLDPNKGFAFFGNVGTGKTTILDAHRRIQSKLCPMIHSRNAAKGVFKWGNNSYNPNDYVVYLDDLGTEEVRKMDFGQVSAPIVEFLEKRYELFSSNRLKTHMTSNIDESEIQLRYGTRILSRLSSMCNFILLDGDDWRIIDGVNDPYGPRIEEYKSRGIKTKVRKTSVQEEYARFVESRNYNVGNPLPDLDDLDLAEWDRENGITSTENPQQESSNKSIKSSRLF
jgi:hypothetical protein